VPDQSVTASHEQDAASASSSTKKPSLGRVIAAWGVHLFTISGLVWATLALFAILDNDTPMMWLWFVIALIVDGVDGTLARKVGVREVIPWFDGGVVDNLVDYLTWTFLPALFMALHLPCSATRTTAKNLTTTTSWASPRRGTASQSLCMCSRPPPGSTLRRRSSWRS